MATSRRTFFKFGIIGAFTLAAGGTAYRMLHAPASLHHFELDGEAALALGAIIPALLGLALPETPEKRAAAIASATEGVRLAVLGLPLTTQKEVQDLFSLLALAPARRFVAGISDSWADARPDQVSAFLQSWRMHHFAMLQTAYLALHDLVLGSWYADPANWAAISYPGPLKELS
ncbi:MAG: hypothetical protein ACI83P_000979 [Janthinobacterium sp.]|jgi:hypothetical protein